MPMRTPRVSRAAIFARDRGICQYTGEFVGKSGGNLDHVVPRDRGGHDSFENLVWSKKEINSFKANRLPHEAGLRLMRKPYAPKPLPLSATIREARHPDWRHFLHGYLLVAIVKQELALPNSLHEVLQVVSISALEKVPLAELFAKLDTTRAMLDIPIQLEINGF
jgi:hypothetical protein